MSLHAVIYYFTGTKRLRSVQAWQCSCVQSEVHDEMVCQRWSGRTQAQRLDLIRTKHLCVGWTETATAPQALLGKSPQPQENSVTSESMIIKSINAIIYRIWFSGLFGQPYVHSLTLGQSLLEIDEVPQSHSDLCLHRQVSGKMGIICLVVEHSGISLE